MIDNSTPARTIQANGVTIEVVQHQSAPHVTYAQVPVAYESAPVGYQPAPVAYTDAPMLRETARIAYAAPDVAPAAYATVEYAEPAMIETMPVVANFEGPSDFDALPVISAEDADLMRYRGGYDQRYDTAMMETIDPGYGQMMPVGEPMNILPEPATPVMKEMDIPRSLAPAVDLGPVETTPVYGGDTERMPMVSMPETVVESRGTGEALMAAHSAMQSDFAVYFGFDSDAVTLEAEDVLTDTVERIKLSGATRVTLTGFTDSMGDARYNQLLAMRRSQAVRKYLQQMVGGDVTFEILPIGEVQAVENGGDGVMEALNRRVEVSIQ